MNVSGWVGVKVGRAGGGGRTHLDEGWLTPGGWAPCDRGWRIICSLGTHARARAAARIMWVGVNVSGWVGVKVGRAGVGGRTRLVEGWLTTGGWAPCDRGVGESFARFTRIARLACLARLA